MAQQQVCANVILAPARIYYAPIGTTLPDPDSVAYNADWAFSWQEVGYTGGPAAIGVTYDTAEATVEQVAAPIKRRRVSEAITLETTLAEITATNLSLGTEGTVTTVAAAPSTMGYEDLDLASGFEMTERMWGIEGLYEASSGTNYPVRIFIYRATSEMNGTLDFAKDTQAGIPLSITTLYDCDNSLVMKFQRVTADAA